jgi:hypothetical protein
MAALGYEPDVIFYNLIHQLVGGPQKGDADRRQGLRHACLATQWIAPGYCGEVPPEAAFIEVRCQDLTGSGFSFFLDEPPDFSRLVAAFGRPPSLVHVAAEVLHWSEVIVYPSGLVEPRGDRAGHVRHQSADGQAGRPMVLVGCRFVAKLL